MNPARRKGGTKSGSMFFLIELRDVVRGGRGERSRAMNSA